MGVYHPCGAFLVEDATNDGKTGIYGDHGYRVVIDTGGSGVYDSTGARRVTDASLEEDFVGKYAADGSWNVTIVDGSQTTGLWAANGSINVVLYEEE